MIGSLAVGGRRLLAVLFVMLVAGCGWAWVRSSATAPLAPVAALEVNVSHLGDEFALGAVGLSMEARELGTGHLTRKHHRLVRLMRLLGPSVLRIGGDSVDVSWWTSHGERAPSWATSSITPASFRALRGLLDASGWRVLLGVNLGHFEPARAADEAHYAQHILGTRLLGIEIGNEPNSFREKTIDLRAPSYSISEYLGEVEAYRHALAVATPAVPIYGPATGETQWLNGIGVAAHMFSELTQHYYPISACTRAPSSEPSPTDLELLAPSIRQQEDGLLRALVLAEKATGRPARIGETNSVACGGDIDASPGFAGALWSLDWALRAGSSGVRGLNFHGSPRPCAPYPESPICALGDERSADAGDVTAQPEYYGLLAARQLEGGRFAPTDLVAPTPLPEITTWATVTTRGIVKIAIDNFESAGLAQPIAISVAGYKVTEELLGAPSVGASRDITLGGVAVTKGGMWHPKPVSIYHMRRVIRMILRPASAAIVMLRPVRRAR